MSTVTELSDIGRGCAQACRLLRRPETALPGLSGINLNKNNRRDFGSEVRLQEFFRRGAPPSPTTLPPTVSTLSSVSTVERLHSRSKG
jgi:hypothetical protein